MERQSCSASDSQSVSDIHKVLHEICADYSYIDNPLTSREESILGFPTCVQLVEYTLALREKSLIHRVRWSEMAALLGAPYDAQITWRWFSNRLEQGCWARFMNGPRDGGLQDGECEALVNVLRRHTGDQQCFFRFSPIAYIYFRLRFPYCVEELLTNCKNF